MEDRYILDVHALKIAITAAGYDTYKALAEAMECSDRTVAAIIKGSNPTYPVMQKLVRTLKLTSEQAGTIFFKDNLRTE